MSASVEKLSNSSTLISDGWLLADVGLDVETGLFYRRTGSIFWFVRGMFSVVKRC